MDVSDILTCQEKVLLSFILEQPKLIFNNWNLACWSVLNKGCTCFAREEYLSRAELSVPEKLPELYGMSSSSSKGPSSCYRLFYEWLEKVNLVKQTKSMVFCCASYPKLLACVKIISHLMTIHLQLYFFLFFIKITHVNQTLTPSTS